MKMERFTPEMNELKIVFIYDRLSCRREEDDPKDAILYFHPSSISVEKRIAICGQLMGVTHFFSDTLSPPRILTLANGKFALRNFDERYVLAIGCSSLTTDWLLDKEADILERIIKFFHCDIKTILRNANYDRALVTTKLMAMMDHYIPVSQQHGDLFSLTFGILPILYLPKSANNISLQASVLLQTCMLKMGVLGGIVTYQNKVVGVELGQSLAQKLAFTQPYRMPPADLVKLDFKLPIGVQIFRVYITEVEFQELQGDSSKFQRPETYRGHQSLNSKKEMVPLYSMSHFSMSCKQPINSNWGGTPKQNGTNMMRKPIEEEGIGDYGELTSKIGREDSDMSSGIHSDENDLHVLNMLHNDQNQARDQKSDQSSLLNGELNGYGKIKPRRCQSVVDLYCDSEFEIESEQNGTSPIPPRNHSSLNKRLGASVSDPTFPYFTPDGLHSVSSSFQNSQSTESGEDEDGRSFGNGHQQNGTQKESPIASTPLQKVELTTPTSVRRPMDLPLSQPNKLLSEPRRIKKKLWATFQELISPVDSPEPLFDNLINNGHDSKVHHKHSIKAQNAAILGDTELQKVKNNPTGKIPESIHVRLLNSFRKLSSHDEAVDDGGDGDGESSSSFSTSTSTCSDTEKFDVQTSTSSSSSLSRSSRLFSPPKILNALMSRPEGLRKKDKDGKGKVKVGSVNETPRKEVALYIYYDGSMRLLLLLDKHVETNRDLIESLWEYVSCSLIQLKLAMSSVEEQSSFSNQSDPYCFLRYESIWKSLAHGGRNESMDFNTVQIMHRDFTRHPSINELIIRGDDHVVYGYQCVGSEVYYQQRAGLQPGLPMPSDLMGKVPLKAKRRLERDHSIVLL